MKNRFYKMVAACMIGAMAFMAVRVPVYATGNVDAGITAVLSESLGNQEAGTLNDAGISAVLSASLADAGGDGQAGEAQAEAPVQEAEPEAPKTICGYTNLGIANVENHLNVREGAGEEFELVGELPVDAGCEILAENGGWYQIQSGDVTGYVKSDYLLTGEAAAKRAEEVKSIVARSATMTLNVRTEPSTESTIWTTMAEGEELHMLEDLGDWLKVEVDGDECYVAKDYVELSDQLQKAMTMSEIKYGQGVSDVRVDMVQYACQFIGNRYVWGGESLTNGVDCSGFTMKIYENYGVYLPHSSSAQAGCGTKINSSDAKPGDLFFYGNGSGINHVAMYIGDGQVVHASSERTGIKISNAFYRTPVCVVRYLSE
ncbi:MAG: SH3 domain-containing protein [Lachnospiraceae bacterium]|jgi:uncharacterized protein YraI|nr:SH3 domain-containing protein [Lachnospiraceae bacterium]